MPPYNLAKIWNWEKIMTNRKTNFRIMSNFMHIETAVNINRFVNFRTNTLLFIYSFILPNLLLVICLEFILNARITSDEIFFNNSVSDPSISHLFSGKSEIQQIIRKAWPLAEYSKCNCTR